MTVQTRIALAVLTSALLAACGSAPNDKGAAATAAGQSPTEKMAAAKADLPRPDPGLYRTTVQIVEFILPGAPKGAAEMMQNSMKQDRTSEYCVTAADVQKGYEEMFRRSQKGDCTFDRFDVVDGRIASEMTCHTDGGGTSNIIMAGKAGRTSSDMDITMKMELPGIGPSTMRMKSQSKRIGPCP